MRPKVILQLYPMLPAVGEGGRKRQRPIGRDSDLYHRVVHEWLDIIKAADDMGVWGASTIEHHLHSEGYEVGPNPGVLNAWWAGQIKNLHVGALGYVMATQDPIPVAEETAILDHITKGKYFVRFARGYQSRWTNILGQFTNSVATVSDGSAEDIKNRDIFEERVEMVLRCWQEMVVLDGRYYKAPYPLDTGVSNYPAVAIARDAGARGEIDADGNVRRISVVPAPYQKPHPPVFVATSKSDNWVRYCGRNRFNPTSSPNSMASSGKAGSMSKRPPRLAGSSASASTRTSYAGCISAKPRPTIIASCGNTTSTSTRTCCSHSSRNSDRPEHGLGQEHLRSSRICSGGGTLEFRYTPDWQRTYRQITAEFITVIFHYAQQPKDDVIRELELFISKVVPSLEAAEPDVVAAR